MKRAGPEVVIALSSHDVEWCADYGRQRSEANRAANVVDKKRCQDGQRADFEGMLGELAVARWLDVPVDTTIAPRSGGIDLVKDGFRFDAKATSRANGRLIATTKVNDLIDVYALVLLHRMASLVAVLPGYAMKAELINPANLVDLGHGPTYALSQDRLRKWKQRPQPKPQMSDEHRLWVVDYEREELRWA